MSTLFSIGAMNQLGDALENAGFNSEDVTKLKQFTELKKIKDVLSGKAIISYPEHIIDCDAAPFVPNGWSVEEHHTRGQLKFDASKVILHLSKKQAKGAVNGNDLQKDLATLPTMNANVLDHLLAHPDLIPETWKGKYICFWGTIYRNSDGILCVRCLYWSGSWWGWGCRWLGDDFFSGFPAALAS